MVSLHTPLTLYYQRVEEASQIFFPMFYQNDLSMRNTADVTGGKPIVVCSQSISGVSCWSCSRLLRHLVVFLNMVLNTKGLKDSSQTAMGLPPATYHHFG
jgi:hypothetical protein